MKNMLVHWFARTVGFGLNVFAWVWPTQAGRFAFTLWCRPARFPIKPQHKAWLTAAKAFVLTDGADTLQGYRWGNGPRQLLLLHGWESHTGYWKPILDRLDLSGWTVTAIDAPGHGLSTGNFLNLVRYAGAIQKLVDTHGPFDATACHSLGGFATVYLLRQQPDLPIGRLALLGCTSEASSFLAYFQQIVGASERVMGELRAQLVQHTGHGPSYFNLVRLGTDLTMPGLLLHDPNDPQAPFANVQRLHKQWPDSTLHLLPGSGHNVRGEATPQLLQAFLAEVVHPVGQPKRKEALVAEF